MRQTVSALQKYVDATDAIRLLGIQTNPGVVYMRGVLFCSWSFFDHEPEWTFLNVNLMQFGFCT